MSVVVPADVDQFVFPLLTELFLTSVWSFVAFVTPATSHPEPGSPPVCVPIISIMEVSLSATLNKPRTSSPLNADIELSVVSASASMVASAEECATT